MKDLQPIVSISALLLTFAVHGSTSWRFLVFGDSRGSSVSDPVNTAILTEIAQAGVAEKPEFVLAPGDLVWAASTAAFNAWKSAMAPLYNAGIPVYPIMGNHEMNHPSAFIEAFGEDIPDNGPPGEINRTYALTRGNVMILMLDTYVNIHRVNQPWINAILATNILPHVFAVGHEPAFKVRHAGILDAYPRERDIFWRSLEFGGAAAYFCGHDHFYDHARLDNGDGDPFSDVHQYIVGTAGAPLYDDGASDGNNGFWNPHRIFHEKQYGYVVVEINGMEVTIDWKHRAAPGVYCAGGDTHSRTARIQRPILGIRATDDRISLHVRRLTPGTLNTVQETDAVNDIWLTSDLFTAVSNCWERSYPAPSRQRFYRIHSQ